jgi:2-polyprenyl-3-methyl-5-hydroxy-6-metoxy-1,4-benzoquinol methylase
LSAATAKKKNRLQAKVFFMAENFREEKYEIEGHAFAKRYAGDAVTFLCDGGEVDIAEWNRLLNEVRPMSLVEKHGNPLVRLKESHRRRAFLALAGGVAGLAVADVGCEEGWLSEQLAGKCAKLYCIDIDAAVLERTRMRLARKAGAAETFFIANDIRKIELPDNSVDVCLASEVLEHLPRPEEGLSEIVRITRAGGRIALSVPNEELVLAAKRAARAAGLGRSLGPLSGGLAVGHVQRFTIKKIRELCDGRIRLDTIRLSAPFFLNIFAAGTPIKK